MQVHQFPELREQVQSLGGMYDILDYDGCSTLWFNKWEDAKNFFSSKSHQALGEDCAHFMDTKKGVKVFIGCVSHFVPRNL